MAAFAADLRTFRVRAITTMTLLEALVGRRVRPARAAAGERPGRRRAALRGTPDLLITYVGARTGRRAAAT